MFNQLANDESIRQLSETRYRDLRHEADRERLARQASLRSRNNLASLAPVGVALALLLVVAMVLL